MLVSNLFNLQNEVSVTYVWLGLEGLAHRAKDLDVAAGEAGVVGGFGRHGC